MESKNSTAARVAPVQIVSISGGLGCPQSNRRGRRAGVTFNERARACNQEVRIVWLTAVALAIGALGITTFIARHGRIAARPDLGWMSQSWLAEHRAGSR